MCSPASPWFVRVVAGHALTVHQDCAVVFLSRGPLLTAAEPATVLSCSACWQQLSNGRPWPPGRDRQDVDGARLRLGAHEHDSQAVVPRVGHNDDWPWTTAMTWTVLAFALARTNTMRTQSFPVSATTMTGLAVAAVWPTNSIKQRSAASLLGELADEVAIAQ